MDLLHYVDELVPPTLQDEIENRLTFFDGWSYTPDTSAGAKLDKNNKNLLESFQLVRMMYSREQGPMHEFYDLIVKPMMYFFEHKTGVPITEEMLIRVKANLLTPIEGRTNDTHSMPHVDMTIPKTISMVYYVNETDGDTFFFDKYEGERDQDMHSLHSKHYKQHNYMDLTVMHRQPPKKGSAIIFDANRYHASSNPTVGARRIINFCTAVDNYEGLK